MKPGYKKVVTTSYMPTINGISCERGTYYPSAKEAQRVAEDEAQRRAGHVVCDCGRVIGRKPGNREKHMAEMIQALLYALPKHWDERISEATRERIDEAQAWIDEIKAHERGVRA